MSLAERLRRKNIPSLVGFISLCLLSSACSGEVQSKQTNPTFAPILPSPTRSLEPTKILPIPTRRLESTVSPTNVQSFLEILDHICKQTQRPWAFYDVFVTQTLPGQWTIDDNSSVLVDRDRNVLVLSRDQKRVRFTSINGDDNWSFTQAPGHNEVSMKLERPGQAHEFLILEFLMNCPQKKD